MHLRVLTVLAVAAVAVAACQRETAQQTAARIQAESEAARTELEAFFAAYGRRFSAGHLDSLVAQYDAEAHVLPPNSPPIHGRDGVRQMYGSFFQGGPVGELRFKVEDVTVNGPVAIVRVGWIFTPPAGAPMPADTGAGIEHLHQADDHWLIVQEIWRSNRPMPPPPSQPRQRS